MSITTVIILILTVLLTVYLVATLLRPEKF